MKTTGGIPQMATNFGSQRHQERTVCVEEKGLEQVAAGL